MVATLLALLLLNASAPACTPPCREGDMVATLAWNTTRHMEAWFGIMGSGAVCHTVNPRLSDKDVRFIVNDAGGLLLLADITFAAQVGGVSRGGGGLSRW